MPQKKHLIDQVVDDLGAWMTTTRQHLVEGFYQGDRAPFAADIPGTEAVALYRDKLFPDGQRDEAEIDRFLKSRGESAYARLLLEIDRMNKRDLKTEAPPRPAEPPAQEDY